MKVTLLPDVAFERSQYVKPGENLGHIFWGVKGEGTASKSFLIKYKKIYLLRKYLVLAIIFF